MDSSSTRSAPHRPRLSTSLTLAIGGVSLAALWVLFEIDTMFLVGLSLGLVTALGVQWAQIAWFTANVRRSEHLEWIGRLPPSMAAFRRPLRAMIEEMDEREADIAEAVSREQVRSVEAATLRSKVQTLESALSETRNDMLDLLDGLGTLEDAPQDATIARIARIASLRGSLQGPTEMIPLGETITRIASVRTSVRDRVVLSEPLPTVSCPSHVIETLIDELLAELADLSVGEIRVSGQSDGGMAILTFSPGDTAAAVSPDVAVPQRAARLLGGEVWISADRSVLVAIPQRYEPGMEALHSSSDSWDISELL